MPFMGLFMWVAIGLTALAGLGGAVKWIRADAVADYRRHVDMETAKLIEVERQRTREIIAKAESEAREEEKEDRQREILLAEAGARISELEAEAAKVSDKGKPCVVPREMVKAINKAGR